MRPVRSDDRDRLYFTLDRTYRRRATRAQIALIAVALALCLGTVYAHHQLVFQPSQIGFALPSLPYHPWYLAQEEALPLLQGIEADAKSTARSSSALAPAAMAAQSINLARPNLLPQPAMRYSSPEIAGKIEAYLESKGAGPSTLEMAVKAQELADAYASPSGAGVSAFPLEAALERSILERGWLWDLREGCEPQMYLKFPAGQLDAMGCGLVAIHFGKPFAVGVALVEKKGAGPTPVIAVVWENK